MCCKRMFYHHPLLITNLDLITALADVKKCTVLLWRFGDARPPSRDEWLSFPHYEIILPAVLELIKLGSLFLYITLSLSLGISVLRVLRLARMVAERYKNEFWRLGLGRRFQVSFWVDTISRLLLLSTNCRWSTKQKVGYHFPFRLGWTLFLINCTVLT